MRQKLRWPGGRIVSYTEDKYYGSGRHKPGRSDYIYDVLECGRRIYAPQDILKCFEISGNRNRDQFGCHEISDCEYEVDQRRKISGNGYEMDRRPVL